MAQVAILGTGRMGSALAKRILLAGHQLVVWNRSRASAEQLVKDCGSISIRIVDTPTQAATAADFIISSLANGEVTQDVLLDPFFLDALREGSIVCDMGTSGINTALALRTKYGQLGHQFVDAPVSGSVATADAGQLLVMASGNSAAVDAMREIFSAFSKQVTYLGIVGNGQAMKLAVNLVVHGVNAALSEALVFATRAGLTAKDAYGVFEDSVIGSPFVRYKRESFLTTDAPVAMTLDLVKKDLGLISNSAAHLGVNLLVTKAVADAVGAACEFGFGAKDMAALSRFLLQVPSTAADSGETPDIWEV